MASMAEYEIKEAFFFSRRRGRKRRGPIQLGMNAVNKSE